MSNPYEDAARVRKASKLVAAARDRGLTADELATFGPEERVKLAEVANVVVPMSDVVWTMTVDGVRFEESRTVPDRRYPNDDAFSLFPGRAS